MSLLAEVRSTPEYLRFERVDIPGRKTPIWNVLSARSGDLLGRVAWYGPWRSYVLASEHSAWSPGCMAAVIEFIAARMAERG